MIQLVKKKEEPKKRAKKATNKNSENKEEAKLKARDRVKLHRERKKIFYENLEKENEELREENLKLKEEIKALNERLNSTTATKKTIVEELMDEENFIYGEIPKMIRSGNEFRYTLYEQTREKCFWFGSLRVKMLKHAFRTIIDHLLPVQFKLLMTASTQSTIPRLVKIMQSRANKKTYKYRKIDVWDTSTDPEGNMSVTASDGQQVVSESFEEFISKFEFTQDFMKYWGQGAAKNVKFYKGLIEEMHNLIRVRNRILTLLKEIHESYYNRDIYKGYSKDDICTVGDIWQQFKTTEFAKPCKLFNLPERINRDDVYEDDELSDTE